MAISDMQISAFSRPNGIRVGLLTGINIRNIIKDFKLLRFNTVFAPSAISTCKAGAGLAWENNADDLNKIYTQKYIPLFLMINEAGRNEIPLVPDASVASSPDITVQPLDIPSSRANIH